MSSKPSNKTTTTVVSGALVTVIVWIANTYGVDIPAEVAAAIVTLIATAIGYFMVAKSGKYVVLPEEQEEEYDDEVVGDGPKH